MGKPTNAFKIKGSTTHREKLSPDYLDYKARILSLVCLAKIKNSKGRDEVGSICVGGAESKHHLLLRA